MSAIFKREFKTYFTSPIGYIILAMIFFISGRRASVRFSTLTWAALAMAGIMTFFIGSLV